MMVPLEQQENELRARYERGEMGADEYEAAMREIELQRVYADEVREVAERAWADEMVRREMEDRFFLVRVDGPDAP